MFEQGNRRLARRGFECMERPLLVTKRVTGGSSCVGDPAGFISWFACGGDRSAHPQNGGQPMRIRLTVAVLITVAAIASIIGPASAANGFFYPTPSWDQQFACATSANCPRFVVLSNWIDAAHPSGGAAVLDMETGLVWQQNPSSTLLAWAVAVHDPTNGCMGATTGGRLGWRAPTIEELTSLFGAFFEGGPVLPPGHPFGPNANGDFWSSTTSAFGSNMAEIWQIGGNGGTNGFELKTASHPVWCVRSPAPGFVLP
jgi:hypothetical protein